MAGQELLELLGRFPNVRLGQNCWEKSPESENYNCIAWAAGEQDTWWDPRPQLHPWAYWPRRAPRGLGANDIAATFAAWGYAKTSTTTLETGIEKVAIFVDRDGRFTHMARQLPSGMWTSKIGNLEDIEHNDPSVLEDGEYGNVAVVLARKSTATG